MYARCETFAFSWILLSNLLRFKADRRRRELHTLWLWREYEFHEVAQKKLKSYFLLLKYRLRELKCLIKIYFFILKHKIHFSSLYSALIIGPTLFMARKEKCSTCYSFYVYSSLSSSSYDLLLVLPLNLMKVYKTAKWKKALY